MKNRPLPIGNREVQTPRTGVFFAGALAMALLTPSCSTPGIKYLNQPMADSPTNGALIHPGQLTPETQSALKREKLNVAFKRDPAKAISILRERMESGEATSQPLVLIELCSDAGDRLADQEPRAAVGYHLAAAELAFDDARGAVGSGKMDDPHVVAYNHSSGRVAKLLFDSGHSWGQRSVFKGPWKSYRFRLQSSGDSRIDPGDFDDIEDADYIEMKNYDMERIRQDGVGAAMIAHRKGTPERREANPFLSPIGMTVPTNAILDFSRGGGDVELQLTDLLLNETTVIHGRKLPLSSDLTVPLAVQVDYDIDRAKGFRAMTHPANYLEHTGLYELEPFRPDQIPVILVHGLMSSPEVWLEAINQLRSDPVLGHRYQLLVFRYPSGYPVIYNVATLRKQLAAFQKKYDPYRRNPNLRRMIVMGHSMGGILSNSQIRGSGDVFTDYLFTRPIDEIGDLDAEQKAALKDLLIYEANPDITRAILVAGPHRGSDLATGGVGALGHKLIKFSREEILSRPLEDIEGMTEKGKTLIANRPDSIGSLEPGAPVLLGILENPVRKGVRVHTIVAQEDPDIPLEESDDETVAYTSAHLDEATSEKVIHATHTTICQHPEAIEEMRRIFYRHAGLR
tara:strand:+ start:1211 stop:3088 length:1878 start_codon:yes stop_codon:yes gene_type:complete